MAAGSAAQHAEADCLLHVKHLDLFLLQALEQLFPLLGADDHDDLYRLFRPFAVQLDQWVGLAVDAFRLAFGRDAAVA